MESQPHSLIAELQRRRVVRALIAYSVAAFAVLQIFRLQLGAMAEHDLGHAGESKRLLAELTAKYAHSGAWQIAVAHAWCGEGDAALQWLDVAITQHDGGTALLQLDPAFRKLRGDARYKAALHRIHLD